MKLVYFSYPYSSNPKVNTEMVKRVVRGVLEKHGDIVPIVPHLVFDALYDFPVGYTHPEFGLMELEIISRCDLVAYVPGTERESAGVRWELCFAEWLGIPVVKVGDL